MVLLRPGDTFADCRILSLCGSGGMGVVYLAEDLLHRKVALKIVAVTDAERELRGLQQYIHAAENNPGMVRIYHAGIEQGQLVYIMEAADPLNPADPVYSPKTLGTILKQQGILPPQEAVEIIRQLGEGLRQLHEAHLVHRDIKPENIIFVQNVPKLCDPGLVCREDASVSFSGTLGYLPHECFNGENLNSPDRDLYALGMVFYVAVTGGVPSRYPRMPVSLSFAAKKRLWPLLIRVCNANPRRRFPSAAELLAALPDEIPSPNWIDRLSESFREYRLLHPRFLLKCTTALLIFLLCAGTLSAYLIHSSRQKAAHLEKCRRQCLVYERKLNENPENLFIQLESETGAELVRQFKEKLARLPQDPVARLRQLENMNKKLTELASGQIPPFPEKCDDAAAERISSCVRSLLASPLGAWLPQKKRAETEKRTAFLEQRHITRKSKLKPGKKYTPDHDFSQNFVYIPAGIFRDRDGKTVRIRHGFWCGDSEISSYIFSRETSALFRLYPKEQPQVKFCWNDLLDCCRSMTLRERRTGTLPEGYIFRPLTTQEWFWVHRNAWHNIPEAPDTSGTGRVQTIYTGTPSRLGIYHIAGNVSEITLSAEDERMGNCIHLCGGNCYKPPRVNPPKIRYLKYQDLPPYVGSRIAVAPGDLEFFEREHWYVDDRPLRWKDRIYQNIGGHIMIFTQQHAEDVCELLGGHLTVPDDPELRKKLKETFWENSSFSFAVDAKMRNGKLVTSAGVPYRTLPAPAPPATPHLMLAYCSGTVRYSAAVKCSGILCDWSKAEYEKRTDLVRILKSRCIRHTFRSGNKMYVLIQLPSMVFPVRQIAMLLGAQLAEPRTEELQKLIKKELAPWSRMPIFLGGSWKFDRWVFQDGTEMKMDLKRHGNTFTNSINACSPGLQEGVFYALQTAKGFLLEFPLP